MGLEEKVKQHLENDPGSSEDADIPKGYVRGSCPLRAPAAGGGTEGWLPRKERDDARLEGGVIPDGMGGSFPMGWRDHS